MDGSHFDSLTRTMTAPISRRVTLGGLAAGVLLALGLALDETTGLARKKGKKGKNNKKKKKCPFNRPRCGGDCCDLSETCQGNRCLHTCRDGVLNNGESDVDCGRVCAGVEGADRCELLKRCNGPQDCRSNFCVERPSGLGTVCAECFLDEDCGSSFRPRCLDNLCFECSLNSDCTGLTPPHPFCIAVPVAAGLNPAPCPSNAPCLCAECRNDGDCPAERPHCQTDPGIVLIGRCLECLDDEHCPEGHLCDEEGRCEELCPGPQRQGVRSRADTCPNTCESDDDCPGGCCDTGFGECVALGSVAHCAFCGDSCPGQFPSCVVCCSGECMEFSREGNPDCDCP